jgi:hypothetical protein
MRGTSLLPEDMFASEEGLCSMELFEREILVGFLLGLFFIAIL